MAVDDLLDDDETQAHADAGPFGREPRFEDTLQVRFRNPHAFILDPKGKFVPYASAGLDIHFLKSVIEGNGGDPQSPLGENDEVSTKVGFALRGGVGYRLGPGLLTGEVTFSWAPLDHEITGDSHLGRIAILVGYTAIFGF